MRSQLKHRPVCFICVLQLRFSVKTKCQRLKAHLLLWVVISKRSFQKQVFALNQVLDLHKFVPVWLGIA